MFPLRSFAPRLPRLGMAALVALALAAVFPGSAFAQKILTIATLAPKKSAWDKVFSGMAQEIEKNTGGTVKLRIYAGGVQGDEEVAVQKIKTGQVQGAAITSIGLGKISPNVLVLQVPLLFDSWEEVDYVRDQMKAKFEEEFRGQGFVLLGWGDVGFVHVFSNEPIHKPADVGKVKMWAWSADPIASTFMSEAGGNPIPLPVPDVLPNLETSLIDAFYNSPLAAIALRWFTKIKYMNRKPIAVGLGATVLSQTAWDTLTPDEQRVVREAGEKWHKILIKKVRKDNAKSLELLAQHGVTVIDVSAEDEDLWKAVAKRTEAKLAGKVYSQGMLDEVHRHLAVKRNRR